MSETKLTDERLSKILLWAVLALLGWIGVQVFQLSLSNETNTANLGTIKEKVDKIEGRQDLILERVIALERD